MSDVTTISVDMEDKAVIAVLPAIKTNTVHFVGEITTSGLGGAVADVFSAGGPEKILSAGDAMFDAIWRVVIRSAGILANRIETHQRPSEGSNLLFSPKEKVIISPWGELKMRRSAFITALNPGAAVIVDKHNLQMEEAHASWRWKEQA